MEKNLKWFLEEHRKRLTDEQIEMIWRLLDIGNFNMQAFEKNKGAVMNYKRLDTAVFLYDSSDMKLSFTIEF